MTDWIRRVDWIVVHHSASPRTTTVDQIRQWHTDPKPEGRGWSDIGYHYLITAAAKIVVGRQVPRIGAHVRGKNSHAVGICVIGNNTESKEEWTPLQIVELNRLVDSLQRVFPGAKLVGHKDLVATECPGCEITDVVVV